MRDVYKANVRSSCVCECMRALNISIVDWKPEMFEEKSISSPIIVQRRDGRNIYTKRRTVFAVHGLIREPNFNPIKVRIVSWAL